jgi:hypothetical protein
MVGLVGTVGSCTQRSLNALNPCTINGVVQNVPVNPQRALDLLILIDESTSMLDEQAKLQEQVPRLVNLLLTGGEDTDGSTPVGTFPAIESLHVAIITPDLGYSTDPSTSYAPNGDFTPPDQCRDNGGAGKAGFMQVTGFTGTPREACDAVTPPQDTLYLNFPEPNFTAADLVSDVECLTGQQDGCGFEQQLQAILESDSNPANSGFNREDALLAVILITDEDDCSTTDPRVFDTVITPGTPYEGPFTTGGALQPNLRCWAHSDALQPVQRYVEEVAKLKSDPSQIVFAAITGIPEDSMLDRENFDTDADRYAAILAHPAMEETPDPDRFPDAANQALTPACTTIVESQESIAFPGRRIVETMSGLAQSNNGIGTVVESICADDYAPALNAIVDRIAAALRQLCLPRPLNRNSQDLVGCEVREVQPAGAECDEARGRESIGTEDVGPAGSPDVRNVCRITQLPSDPAAGVPSGLGWFYDDFTPETVSACTFNPEQQRVSFTEGADPTTGARIRFECLQAAPPTTEDVGWPCTDAVDDGGADTICNPNPDNCLKNADGTPAETLEECETRILKERYDRDNLKLTCDGQSNTCQLSCETNVECPGGFACYDETGDGNSYCVNPTCTLN